MSYSIYYRKQFISLGTNQNGEELFIPMVESGDNNVWEAARPRRARDWNFRSDFTGKHPFATEQQMLDNVTECYYSFNRYGKEDNITEKEYQKKYGYYSGIAINGSTHRTTWGMFLGLIKTGCKQAIPLKEFPGGLKIWIPAHSWTLPELEKIGKKLLDPIYVKNVDEYLDAFKVYSEYYENYYGWVVDFVEEYHINNIYNRRKWDNIEKKRNTTEYIHVHKFFVLDCIKDNVSGYFVKNTKYGYKYTPYNTGAKKFATRKDAERFHKRMRNKDLFQIKEIDLGDFNTVSIKTKKVSLEVVN